MVNSMVERATSDMLIGPDWATNIEICDMLNRDPSQTKDIVRGIKRRLGSKNPKIQILSLTLLETIIKNCGDIVHMHVADKDVLHEMVKIIKKKPDFHVKEKILVLIDTWQEAFGGPMARYPQYYAAYQELLRAGAVFPQRSERAAPVLTPPQTQPLASYPQNLQNQGFRPEVGDSSRDAEFPTLSPREIQNAREIMDVLAEMLNAVDPNKKEGLGQDVIVDLVDQCRTYKQRVVHLVNSTSDESLLCEGLALNDDLQRLLAKHEAIASGTYIPEDTAKHEPPQPPPAVITGPLVDTGSSSAAMPPLQPPASVKTNLDLLSGDDYNSPIANTALALVPVGDLQPKSPVSDQNAIVLFDMFPQSDNPNPPNSQAGHQSEQAYHTAPQIPQPIRNIQPFQPSFNQVAAAPSMNFPESNIQPPYAYGPSIALNGQAMQQLQQQEQPDSTYDALPLPPWEAQPSEVSQNLEALHALPPSLQNGAYAQGYLPMGSTQVGVYSQPSPMFNLTGSQSNQFTGLQHHPQFSTPPQPVYAPVYGYATGYGGYAPKEHSQFIEQRMNGLSLREHGYLGKSFAASSAPSYAKNSPNPSRPEDKLFGDLVDMARIKPSKTTMDESRRK